MTLLRQAQKLVNRYGTNNPERILTAMNVKILSCPMQGLRGIYKQVKRNTFVIVDCALEEQTRAFVLGHELGHHVLHKQENRVFLDRCTFLKTSRFENEANVFSLCLIAPNPHDVIYPGETLDNLACRLGVDRHLAELYVREISKNNDSNYLPI